jgi:tRNA A37 methylthiotransferase MiaB
VEYRHAAGESTEEKVSDVDFAQTAPTTADARSMLTRKVYVEAFGCQMNFLDGELAVSRLSGHGWSRTADPEDADLILFNTCSVRDQSENRVWSRLGALRPRKERDPGLLIGIMGCMAQRDAESILRRMPHVDLVCGTRRFHEMFGFAPNAIERTSPSCEGAITSAATASCRRRAGRRWTVHSKT